jgi:hypothetical protein
MKRNLLQLFHVLMACVVLLSSTGFGLVEHSCQMRGKKKTIVVAFSDAGKQTNCGKHEPAAPSDQIVLKKTDCCQDDQRYENVDVNSSLSQLVAKFVKNVTESILVGVTAMLAWIVEWIFDRSASLSAQLSSYSPPSLSGRDILTLVRTLLI